MDKTKHKTGKKQERNNGKEKYPQFISDVKYLKENLKIKEILRTVKMNSSMRIKAPPGSKVMNNKDFNDNETSHEQIIFKESQGQLLLDDSPEATPLNVVSSINIDAESKINKVEKSVEPNEIITDTVEIGSEIKEYKDGLCIENPQGSVNLEIDKKKSLISETNSDVTDVTYVPRTINKNTNTSLRDRKLSLDQTILSRQASLSQSELDLHSMGKSPLERKSSFFKKKMDSFLKNTTEIFKRQTQTGKTPLIQRRGSMSISLQSLNDKYDYNNGHYNEGPLHNQQELRNSTTSLSTMARSSSIASNISTSPYEQLEQFSSTSSQPLLFASQPLQGCSSNSVNNLNEVYNQDSFLKSRAISMSSGLDAPQGRQRRKALKSNRVTWLASEGLTNYFKRIIQDDKSRERQLCNSYQDFSSIPENELFGPTTDVKGRRLSYQRAVSGEDPVLPSKYYDSTQRRKNYIPEHQEVNYELIEKLDEFKEYGIPTLRGYDPSAVHDESLSILSWTEQEINLKIISSQKHQYAPKEEKQQAAIRELIITEADYIKHMTSIVELFMSTAHALQYNGFLLELETERLFLNIPDVLNSSICFWRTTFYPMFSECVDNGEPLRPELMNTGFTFFREYFQSYELYVFEQNKALDYLRSLSNNLDFMTYLTWCHEQKQDDRLQLNDILVKPMQRLTKYPLILQRIIQHTDEDYQRNLLLSMERNVKKFVVNLDRTIRQRDEIEKMNMLPNLIETYELDFKDDDMDRFYKMYAKLNIKAPMLHCTSMFNRSLIFEGDLRFKDNNIKETEVRAYLLTDMLLICKKTSKSNCLPYKMIRPKYMIDKLRVRHKHARGSKDVESLLIVVVDEVNTSHNCFALYESTKDDKSPGSQKITVLQTWENKIKEAKITYELAIWLSKNPDRDISEVDIEMPQLMLAATSKKLYQLSQDDVVIERHAREGVATMLHGKTKEIYYEEPQALVAWPNDTFDITHAFLADDIEAQRRLRYPTYRASTTASSRTSRMSYFQKSTSVASHDEPQPGPSRIYRPSASVEQAVPVQLREEEKSSDTVEVASGSELVPEQNVELPPAQPPLPESSESQQEMQQPQAQGADENQLQIVIYQPVIQQPRAQQSTVQPPEAQQPEVQKIETPEIQQNVIQLEVPQPEPFEQQIPPQPITQQPKPQTPIIQQPLSQPQVDVPKDHRPQPVILLPEMEETSKQEDRSLLTPDKPRAEEEQIHGEQTGQDGQGSPGTVRNNRQSSVRGRQGPRAASASPSVLRIEVPTSTALVHSLPNLVIEPATPRQPVNITAKMVSDKLYQWHREMLQKRKRSPVQKRQHLKPDDRGTDHKSRSRTRATLTRGVAVSEPDRPPLRKMAHVSNESDLNIELAVPSTSYEIKSNNTSPDPDDSPDESVKSIASSCFSSAAWQAALQE
ncbi:uncharacterized protein [Battus philenor]|uniref:uncharacterized protein n=1 Tax=Battus philenor TaxID=42288 RepID=UPI0035CFAC08